MPPGTNERMTDPVRDKVPVNERITNMTGLVTEPGGVYKIRSGDSDSAYGVNSEDREDESLSGTEESVFIAAVSNIRGYHVMAIVLCCLVLAAIALCKFTWKFRHKIVLRVKDPTKPNTTVVQNLLARTVQSVTQRGTKAPSLIKYEPVHRDIMRLQSWEAPPSSYRKAKSLKKPVDSTRTKQSAARQTSKPGSRSVSRMTSKQISGGVSGVKAARPRAKSLMKKSGHKRLVRLRSIKLSSGLTVPTEVDQRILPSESMAGTSHPLVLKTRDRADSTTSSRLSY